ncbi:Mitogen-activated protein kinase HOG1 (Fragment) [Seminavis robusta]|uniref:non-specific serine/threonine protein kinase n=1 Tax=Seminavis robusta TaxID=568900 RepID=A0A9N8E7M3_9STRA
MGVLPMTSSSGKAFVYRRPFLLRNGLLLMSLSLIVSQSRSEASRAYPLGCSGENPSFYEYDKYPFPPPGVPTKTTDDYFIVERLGTGKFSDVFSAMEAEVSNHGHRAPEIEPKSLVVIKCLKPVTDRKIRRELLILSHASKMPNHARLLAVVIHPKFYESQKDPGMLHRMPSLVLKHAGPDSQFFCHRANNNHAVKPDKEAEFLSVYEIKYFLFHLLVALDSLHSKGIIHRDVKPRNVLITRGDGIHVGSKDGPGPLMLLDLGLADFYLPNTKYNVRVASRHYKSPELLIGFQYYDYGVDLWPVGCMLAGLLFRREPFFRGKDNVDQLAKIVSVLGTPDLIAYISTINVDLSPDVRKTITECAAREGNKVGRRRVPWLSFRAAGTPMPSEESLDLLDKLLVYDHNTRLTAQEAMAHPFFDDVRDRVTNEVRRMVAADSR